MERPAASPRMKPVQRPNLNRFCLVLVILELSGLSSCERSERSRAKSISANVTPRTPNAPPPPTQEVALNERVEFTFGPDIGCLMGDMDTISKEFKKRRNQRLLFSIEPLLASDSNFPPIAHSVDPGESISRGTTVEFALPKVQKLVHLGLFVCKDNENTGSCARKPVYNLSKMSSILFFKRPQRAEKVIASDKIYYFQYLLYDGKTLRFMSETVNNAASFNRWANQLQKQLAASGDPIYHKQALARVNFLQRLLTSKRIEVRKVRKKTELSALLPLFDPESCIKTERTGEPYTPTLSGPTPGYAKPSNHSALPRLPTDQEMKGTR